MTSPTPSTFEGFETLDALQRANLDLLRSWKRPRSAGRRRGAAAPEPDEAAVAPLERFVARARATGSRLSTAASRDIAQAALDYWATELAAHRRGLDAAEPDPLLVPFDPRALPALGGASPFIGLKPFRESDAASYFGREAAVPLLAGRIARRPIVIVQGPSGSGKSSLICAGLLPELRRTGVLPEAADPVTGGQYRLVHVPAAGRDPIATLVGAVLPTAGSDEVAQRLARLRDAPGEAETLLTDPGEAGLLLIIDQFEEVFTLEPRAGDPEALARMLAALGPRHRVVIGIRDDFLTRLEKLPELGSAAADPENRYTPPPLSPEDLRRAIEAPADRAGLRFEEGVVADLVRGVSGEPAGLPLLQFTLARLWDAKRENWVSREVAAEVGPPKVALRRTADALFDAMADENKERTERLFLKLVTPAAENEFVRRPQTRAELQDGEDPGRIDDILRDFTRSGLLRREPGGVPTADRFDVTHEALIRNWPRLRDWLVRFRADNQRFWELRVVARAWKDGGRDPGYLLSGDALRDAYGFRNRSADLDELVRASDDEQARQREAERARARTKQYGIIALATAAVLLAMALAAAGFLFYFKEQAANAAEQAATAADRERQKAAEVQKDFETQRIAKALLKAQQDQAEDASNRLQTQIDALTQAIQALGASPGSVAPLRGFLSQYGASQALLERLQLAPGPAQPGAVRQQLRREDFSETVVAPPTDQVAAPRLDDGSTCTGYLWIGDPTSSKVAAFPDGPTGLDGKTLTVTANIRLRSALPSPGYQMADPVGTVPKGTLVTVKGDATTFARPGGNQWWLRVGVPRQVCVTVLIQYAGDAGGLGPFLAQLRGAGYQVAAPESLDIAKDRSSVRYFFDADRPMATQVAALFSAAMGGRTLKVEPLLTWEPKPAQGTVEVWIDLGGP